MGIKISREQSFDPESNLIKKRDQDKSEKRKENGKFFKIRKKVYIRRKCNRLEKRKKKLKCRDKHRDKRRDGNNLSPERKSLNKICEAVRSPKNLLGQKLRAALI